MKRVRQPSDSVAGVDDGRNRPQPRPEKTSVRVVSRLYLVVLGSLLLLGVVFLSLNLINEAAIFLFLGGAAVPLMALTERVVFDGTALTRTGLMSLIHRFVSGKNWSLHFEEIELVETEAIRTLRRKGSVRYRYRTEILGKNLRFAVSSGGGSYRTFIRRVFHATAPEKLDARSAELRDYLRDEKSLRSTRESLHIASVEVLEDIAHERAQTREQRRRRRPARLTRASSGVLADEERAKHLQFAANELRIAGRLRESGEAFRRALLAMPKDATLIYDFARYLFSEASAHNDAALVSRSNAALRLAARRADRDSHLLSRIGESLAERGELRLASRMFQRALDIEPDTFRASVGLAEIALRSAKLAHVVHHYCAAARTAPDAALNRFAQREADYYERLNSDDDYLEAEVKRISRLQNLQQMARIAARATLAAAAFAAVFMLIEEQIAAAAWSLAAAACGAWIGVTIVSKLLTNRSKIRTES